MAGVNEYFKNRMTRRRGSTHTLCASGGGTMITQSVFTVPAESKESSISESILTDAQMGMKINVVSNEMDENALRQDEIANNEDSGQKDTGIMITSSESFPQGTKSTVYQFGKKLSQMMDQMQTSNETITHQFKEIRKQLNDLKERNETQYSTIKKDIQTSQDEERKYRRQTRTEIHELKRKLDCYKPKSTIS